MDITVTQEKGRMPVTVFQLEGRINLGNAEELEKRAERAYASGMRDLLIDLSQVPSITSAGLRAIHAIYKMLGGAASPTTGEGASASGSRKSAHLKLLSPDPSVLKVIKTAGFDQFMDIYEDKQEAIASF